MDGTATPELATREQTTTATTVPVLDLQQTVRDAAELGWSITELLGRCFALQEEKTAKLDWSGSKLVLLQGILTPREKIRVLVTHILYLANLLDVSSFAIDHPPDPDPDPDNGRRYIEVIGENVRKLTRGEFDSAKGETFEYIRGKINERIFFWDLKIQDALQERPAVIHKAYLVGYSLGSLRWCFGFQDRPLDPALMDKVLHEYIPTLGPYVSQFTTGALLNSVDPWWKAISSQQLKPGLAGPEGIAPAELQRQGHIWSSLVTGESDACSFLDPTIRNRPYLWQVLQVIWPIALVGGVVLLVVLVALLIVILSYRSLIVTGVSAALGFLTTLGVTSILQRNVGDILQKAVADATADIKGSYLDQIWNSTQQKAVNSATYIPPPGIGQKQKAVQGPPAK